VISIEECCHGVQKILVLLQVTLCVDIVQIKDLADVDVLEGRVLFEVRHQLFQELILLGVVILRFQLRGSTAKRRIWGHQILGVS
jgi:hypothetical protein